MDRFELHTLIQAPPERVFRELAEPARFLGLQPFLVSVREIETPSGGRAFEAVERVPFLGPLRLRNRIRVCLAPDPAAGVIRFDTRSAGRIRLRGEFALRAADSATELRQSVELSCPRLLRSFVLARAREAQQALLARLKSRLEGEVGRPAAAAPAEAIDYPRGSSESHGGPNA